MFDSLLTGDIQSADYDENEDLITVKMLTDQSGLVTIVFFGNDIERHLRPIMDRPDVP